MTEIIVVLAVVSVLFLAFREVWCWYWKINEVLAEFRKANSKLERIYDKLTVAPKVWTKYF